MGKPTKILHNVAVGVVLNDVLDPLIAVLISATLRFSRIPFHVEYYDLDETYKEYEEYKYKEYQGKCLKNFSGGVNVRGVFVLGGNCLGGICLGVIVRGVIVLIPSP